ncbi:MAG: NusG domain II-containing protein [Candidatus Riflebacteria bacterium]|nr:NusG domain II-containing protein [Candidatus Riflebacteria bacterium]
MQKNNLIFIITLLAISALAYYFHFASEKTTQYEIRVLAQNKTYLRPLSNRLIVKGYLGESIITWNMNDEVRIEKSPCPNQSCVKMGLCKSIPLICVPNGIIINPIAQKYDAVTGQ